MQQDIQISDAAAAAAFRRLVSHLQHRHDAQNIDLMGWSGFCRNCLGDWLHEEAEKLGMAVSKDEGRTHVYGMSQTQWKALHQQPARQEQMDRMAESLAQNERVR
jgi:hypothetical protein